VLSWIGTKLSATWPLVPDQAPRWPDRIRRADLDGAKCRYRRIFLLAARSSEGPLTEPTAGFSRRGRNWPSCTFPDIGPPAPGRFRVERGLVELIHDGPSRPLKIPAKPLI